MLEASARRVASVLTSSLTLAAAGATVLTILGATVILFFNPLWIGFEQDRAGVPAMTGYTADEVRAVTGAMLADLVVGAGAFGVSVNGQPVLGADERAHMRDVRGVLGLATSTFGTAAALLAALVAAKRHRRWLWRGIGQGSTALAVAGIGAGIATVFFFDSAFLLFHLVFFPQGNFLFDPRTQRLTQLFPTQFWTDTAIAIVVVGVGISGTVAALARRRAARLSN